MIFKKVYDIFWNKEETRPKRLGTTFSQKQCEALNLDYKETFIQLCTLNLDIIRICAYWDQIENNPGSYDFTITDWLVQKAQEQNKPLVLSVGMKAPRWPEFHFPQWIDQKYNTKLSHTPMDSQNELSQHAQKYSRAVIDRYKNQEIIHYIQIENEALNNFDFTHNRFISYMYILQEAKKLKQIAPHKKLLLTNAINIAPFDLKNEYNSAFQKNLSTKADAIGTNVYIKIPINQKIYVGPTPLFWLKLYWWKEELRKKHKEAWITESQAEPWEYGNSVHTTQVSYPSASPQSTIHLSSKLTHIGYQTILLWGCEYWYWHKKQGRDEWWNTIQKYVNS